ncbi:DUF1294 domain-containing protein [Patescibacteria group bacterium]|nr:DUF1294 domain-containing protein [Patescibacteria group bacterium]
MIYFLLYLLLINIVTFAVRGIDKRKAVKEKRRVSEKNLLILTALGGRLGAVVGIQYFRHKTVKAAFAWKLWAVVVARVVICFLILYYAQ